MDEITEFEWIDHYFARVLCQKNDLEVDEETYVFLKRVFKHAREGNLCYRVEEKETSIVNKLYHVMIDPMTAIDTPPLLPLCEYKGVVYLQRNWMLEVKIFHAMSCMMNQELEPLVIDMQADILSGEQQQAIHLFFKSKMMILSGGPGRGKTFTAAKMVSVLPVGYSIVIAAPTGKAANQLYEQIKRLDKAHQIQAKTLHSLLKDKQSLNNADILIIDEASMIDAVVFSKLLENIRPHTRVLIMGDEDQLPSIEAGSIFFEICTYARKSGKIPYAHLSFCHRSDRKEIIKFAEQINAEQIAFPEILKGKTDIIFIPLERIDFHYFTDLGRKYYNMSNLSFDDAKIKMNQFRCLTALKVGPLGSIALNQMIYEYLHQITKDLIIPIMITKTNYDLEIFNGEIGFCFKEKIFLEKNGTWVSFPIHAIPAYEYAYAISIHKSQGSEYDKIALVLPPGSEKFGKQLLYTGVTRAKTQIDLISTPAVLNQCLNNKIERTSGLSMWFNMPFANDVKYR